MENRPRPSMDRERELWADAMAQRQGWFAGARPVAPELGAGGGTAGGRLEQELQTVRDRIEEVRARNNLPGGAQRLGGLAPQAQLGPTLPVPRQALHHVLSSNLVSAPEPLREQWHVEVAPDLASLRVRVLGEATEDGTAHGAAVQKAVAHTIEVALAEPLLSAHWTQTSIADALPPPPTSVRERGKGRAPTRAALRGWDRKKVRHCVTYATLLDGEPAFLFLSPRGQKATVLSVCGGDVRAASAGGGGANKQGKGEEKRKDKSVT